MELSKKEREAGGVLDADTKIVSTITSHGPGYLDKELEQIVGFQTDKPFKRSLMPFGGIRMAKTALESYGFELDKEVEQIFTDYRKTHNQGVFDAYTPEMRAARHAGVITGLPDAYGRGRIIGDYRRVALYGVDFLMKEKLREYDYIGDGTMSPMICARRCAITSTFSCSFICRKLGDCRDGSMWTFKSLNVVATPCDGIPEVSLARIRSRAICALSSNSRSLVQPSIPAAVRTLYQRRLCPTISSLSPW